jgi:hypothetical protein
MKWIPVLLRTHRKNPVNPSRKVIRKVRGTGNDKLSMPYLIKNKLSKGFSWEIESGDAV